MRNYKKIRAWQSADELTVAVYEGTRGFPREEMYGLTSQIRRAAYSVPANIAEGSARESLKDYLYFLGIARGSLAELEYFLHLAARLGYLAESSYSHMAAGVKTTFVLLQGLIKAVRAESLGPSVP
jgi:four helix bundle protein